MEPSFQMCPTSPPVSRYRSTCAWPNSCSDTLIQKLLPRVTGSTVLKNAFRATRLPATRRPRRRQPPPTPRATRQPHGLRAPRGAAGVHGFVPADHAVELGQSHAGRRRAQPAYAESPASRNARSAATAARRRPSRDDLAAAPTMREQRCIVIDDVARITSTTMPTRAEACRPPGRTRHGRSRRYASPVDAAPRYCYRHPDRETGLSRARSAGAPSVTSA